MAGKRLNRKPTIQIAAFVSENDVRYHPGHVWKLLVSLGWSCQRPTGRALERNQPAIRHWKKGTWPDIKKKPKKSGV